jgi:aspartate/methionine/tyrosine aminotransferase
LAEVLMLLFALVWGGEFERCSPDQILSCTPSEGILLVMQALLSPGDHVVCVSPAYQSLFEIAQSMGCEVTPWDAV